MGQVEYDLQHVRSVLDRAESADSPTSIYWLWAVICLIGFPLYDFRPQFASIYWPVVGPLGGFLSFVLGWRWSRMLEQGSMRTARAHALHWSGMLVSIALAVLLVARGRVEGTALPYIIMVILTFGWFTAGVHLIRDYLWIGCIMALGYLGLLYIGGFGWTGVGVLMALSLAWAAWRSGRRNARDD